MVAIKTVNFLVIDDDDVDREAVRRQFQKTNTSFLINESENGTEALEFLRSKDQEYFINNPTVILLDLNMPKMGGIEFLKHIRNDSKLNKLIVFVMTTSDDENDKYQFYNLNIAGYIVKEKLKKGVENTILILDTFWEIIEMPRY
ncbi:MAG: two-component system response regulator [Planctomycetota bacterium]|nr:MAG: two-component system response regulator [Planctomycetota bacterium]